MRRIFLFLTLVLLAIYSSGFVAYYRLMIQDSATPTPTPPRADGSVQNLNTSLIYFSIQSAIDAKETLDGHVIFVKNGIYYEHIVVDKGVSLVGENKYSTIIDGNHTQKTIIELATKDALFEGFTVRNGFRAILIASNFTNFRSTGNIVRNCVLKETSQGIQVLGKLYENYWPSERNVIEGNIIQAGYAIELGDSDADKIVNNVIQNGSYGIEVDYYSFDTLIAGNLLQNFNPGWGQAITLSGSSNTTIVGNTFKSNDYGIFIYGSNSLTNHIYHNNFINNVKQVELLYDPSIEWDIGYPSGGNYWNDYNGTDLCKGSYQDQTGSDGIGDVPYIINENDTDHYPLMKPFETQGLPTLPSNPFEFSLTTYYVIGITVSMMGTAAIILLMRRASAATSNIRRVLCCKPHDSCYCRFLPILLKIRVMRIQPMASNPTPDRVIPIRI